LELANPAQIKLRQKTCCNHTLNIRKRARRCGARWSRPPCSTTASSGCTARALLWYGNIQSEPSSQCVSHMGTVWCSCNNGHSHTPLSWMAHHTGSWLPPSGYRRRRRLALLPPLAPHLPNLYRHLRNHTTQGSSNPKPCTRRQSKSGHHCCNRSQWTCHTGFPRHNMKSPPNRRLPVLRGI